MRKHSLTKRQRLLLYWSTASILLVGLLAVLLIAKPRTDPYRLEADGSVSGLTSVLSRRSSADMVRFRFEEVGQTAGIDFHHLPTRRRSLLPEDMSSGVAWGDYDDDGDLDLYLVNYCVQVESNCSSALYANDGGGNFVDVTAQTGLEDANAGLGATWGDYDNDNDLDLYLTNYGPNRLYRNEGDGTFIDVTGAAGVGDPAFSASAAWGDYDNDGNIDLYINNYVEFTFRQEDSNRTFRQSGSEVPYTLNPAAYPPAPNRLYRNNGDGTFDDVAGHAGVANDTGRSLVSAWVDMDNDGFVDLYVANDVSANGVFHNMGDGTFADIGASSLAADYRGAMGLAVGDFDGDSDFDIFVTHWIAQENALFENIASEGWTDDKGQVQPVFMDIADSVGLGQSSLRMVGWATGFADFDNDADLDLWVVNGNTLEQTADRTLLRPQPMQIFTHQPPDGFFDVGEHAGPVLTTPIVGRGGAQGDFDSDGKLDLCIVVHGGQPWLLHNVSQDNNHWLTVRLRQRRANTRGLGALVSVRTGETVRVQQVGVGGAYLSDHGTDLHFGLGAVSAVDEIVIRWPDGITESYSSVVSDRTVTYSHEPVY